MKRIIKGKVYDTDTAKLIAEASASCAHSDFGYWEEELYQKKTGEYFLHGAGGPASKYARHVEINSWSGGQQIIPLTYEAAREWAEKELGANEYISIFGDPGEGDDGSEIMTISIPKAVAKKIRQEASQNGASISSTIASKF